MTSSMKRRVGSTSDSVIAPGRASWRQPIAALAIARPAHLGWVARGAAGPGAAYDFRGASRTRSPSSAPRAKAASRVAGHHVHRGEGRRPAGGGRPARSTGTREILAANADDVAARRGRRRRPPPWSTGSASPTCGSLAMANGLRAGRRRCPTRWARSPTAGPARTGCAIQRVRVPLGVVAIIYENRPNVTSDAVRPVPEVRQRRVPPGLVGRHPLQHRHRRRAARGPGQGRPARTTPSCSSRTPATRRRSSSCACASRSTCLIPRGGPSLIRVDPRATPPCPT